MEHALSTNDSTHYTWTFAWNKLTFIKARLNLSIQLGNNLIKLHIISFMVRQRNIREKSKRGKTKTVTSENSPVNWSDDTFLLYGWLSGQARWSSGWFLTIWHYYSKAGLLCLNSTGVFHKKNDQFSGRFKSNR